jgi:tetratricopeptide (TPR) repeat protein
MLLFVAAMFAQKSNVNKAKRESESLEKPDFYRAIELIELALEDPSTKNDPYTWWVAGHVYDMQIKYEGEREAAGTGTLDKDVVKESAYKAYDYFVKAAELEKAASVQGKVSDKWTKKLTATLAWYYQNQFILGYGVALADEAEDYKGAVRAFDKHLSIVDLPFMQNYKGTKEIPKPTKDSNYYKLKYFAAYYLRIDGDTLNAIQRFEEIKDMGYNENVIYQTLYDLYEKRGDEANKLKILDDGIKKFSDEPFYIGTMINHLNTIAEQQKDASKYDEALKYLDKAIANNPNTAEYYSVKGFVLTKMNRQSEAMASYDKAIELKPNDPNYIVNKGIFLYEDGVALESSAMRERDVSKQGVAKQQSKQRFVDAKQILLRAWAMDNKNYYALEYLKLIAIREDNAADIKRYTDMINALSE